MKSIFIKNKIASYIDVIERIYDLLIEDLNTQKR